MKILEIKDLCKVYGTGETKVDALKNVTFDVEQGEFVAIVGPSGSGKSTLLHILGGVDSPTSGAVIISGTDISRLDETKLAIFRRRQIGLIYQFYNPRLVWGPVELGWTASVSCPWQKEGQSWGP